MAARKHSRPAQGFSRSDRVAEQIRRELVEILRLEVKDPRVAPRLALITLTDVEVSSDYSHAKVFFTVLAEAAVRNEIAAGLASLAGFLRRELGGRIRLHQIPQLHFVYDASVERGSQLSRLIEQAVESDKRREGE